MRSKNFILFVFLFSLFVTTACFNSNEAETGWDQIKSKGEMIVATSGTLYPESYYASETNELTGYGVEVIREVGKRMGLEIKFLEIAFDGMLTAVNSGQVDMAVNDIGITEQRKEQFAFSVPYKYSYGTAVVREEDLSGIETLADLQGKKAAGEATTIYMEIAREYGATEVIYDNATNDQYLQDVAFGRTDVILNDYYLQRLSIAARPDLGLTIHPNIKYNPSSTGILIHKENTDLVVEINKILQKMLSDGTLSELSKQFFDGADVTEEVMID